MKDRELDQLLQDYPVSPHWERPSVVRHVSDIGGTRIHLAALSTTDHAGQCVTGSAGQLAGSPLSRAYFELIERTSLVEALNSGFESFEVRDLEGASSRSAARQEVFLESPDERRWRYARSNGVAVGRNWQEAALRAGLELVERDRVLRCWYGEVSPQPIDISLNGCPESLHEYYEFGAYCFPEAGNRSEAASVMGVFGFPRVASAPMVFGLGARYAPQDAIATALSECLQRLGFLWGESIPEAPPPFTPTADFHQEYYLHPPNQAKLRAWLDGAHREFRGVLARRRLPQRGCRYADLTPKALRSRLVVAKALAGCELPLAFGRGHPELLCAPPEQLAIHPIA